MKHLNYASPMKNPLIVALDVDSREQALALANDLEDLAGGFKIGPRLCLRYGMKLVQEIAKCGPVFLDNKHFDIPSTMESAVRSSFDAGASLVTVHALAGAEALRLMAKVEAELNASRPFRILCVSILTSWDESSLPSNFKTQSISQHVTDLVELVEASGLKGVVCSPQELLLFKNRGLYLVTPGIRGATNEIDDQKRIMNPADAISLGASALVVGRPIIGADSPRKSAEQFLAAIK